MAELNRVPVGTAIYCMACKDNRLVEDEFPGTEKTLVILDCRHAWDVVQK